MKSDIYVASKSLAIILIVIGSVLLSSLTVVNNDNDSNCLSYCHFYHNSAATTFVTKNNAITFYPQVIWDIYQSHG